MVEYNEWQLTTMKIDILQIGSYIGKDDIHKILEKETSCSAILVEPVPWFYKKLIKNYENIINPSRIIFENSVINVFDGICDFHCMKDEGNDLDFFGININWIKEISSLNLNMIKEHEEIILKNQINFKYETLKLNSITPRSLIKKYNISNVEYLKIDAEGSDFKILECWPFEIISPKYVKLEMAHLDGSVNKKEKLKELKEIMNKKEYSLLRIQDLDIIFYKKNNLILRSIIMRSNQWNKRIF
jgi:FkbM family methyltransferase